jgi:hypothetical protein
VAHNVSPLDNKK